uniref:Uncharacterized protein n=1 Tax=Arundo donax TaxID=35708 RepID=A0A0A9TDF8_ARUDO
MFGVVRVTTVKLGLFESYLLCFILTTCFQNLVVAVVFHALLAVMRSCVPLVCNPCLSIVCLLLLPCHILLTTDNQSIWLL